MTWGSQWLGPHPSIVEWRIPDGNMFMITAKTPFSRAMRKVPKQRSGKYAAGKHKRISSRLYIQTLSQTYNEISPRIPLQQHHLFLDASVTDLAFLQSTTSKGLYLTYLQIYPARWKTWVEGFVISIHKSEVPKWRDAWPISWHSHSCQTFETIMAWHGFFGQRKWVLERIRFGWFGTSCALLHSILKQDDSSKCGTHLHTKQLFEF